jgi:hypothetical protein
MVIVLVACVVKRNIRRPGSEGPVCMLQETHIVSVNQINTLQRIK